MSTNKQTIEPEACFHPWECPSVGPKSSIKYIFGLGPSQNNAFQRIRITELQDLANLTNIDHQIRLLESGYNRETYMSYSYQCRLQKFKKDFPHVLEIEFDENLALSEGIERRREDFRSSHTRINEGELSAIEVVDEEELDQKETDSSRRIRKKKRRVSISSSISQKRKKREQGDPGSDHACSSDVFVPSIYEFLDCFPFLINIHRYEGEDLMAFRPSYPSYAMPEQNVPFRKSRIIQLVAHAKLLLKDNSRYYFHWREVYKEVNGIYPECLCSTRKFPLQVSQCLIGHANPFMIREPTVEELFKLGFLPPEDYSFTSRARMLFAMGK